MTDIPGRAGRPAIKTKVAEALHSRRDLDVSVKEIAEIANVTFDQARQAINTLAREGKLNIDTVVHGTIFRLNSNGSSTKEARPLFQQIGKTKTGALVLEDEDGDLWKAEKI